MNGIWHSDNSDQSMHVVVRLSSHRQQPTAAWVTSGEKLNDYSKAVLQGSKEPGHAVGEAQHPFHHLKMIISGVKSLFAGRAGLEGQLSDDRSWVDP